MKPITPESLYDLITLDDVQVSPDGRYVAFTRTQADPSSNDYRRAIWIKDLSKPNAPARPLTAGPKDRAPRWSPDGAHLAFIAERGDKPQVFVLPMRMPGEARSITAHPQRCLGLRLVAGQPTDRLHRPHARRRMRRRGQAPAR
jgi:dipeptidyl aminopeptidase/acylaminoacyl peptidase